MPFFYDLATKDLTTNVAGNTETDHMLGIAGATQGFSLVKLNVSPKNFATVGAMTLRAKTGGSSAANTAATPNKRHPNNPNPGSTWSTAITAAGTQLTRVSVGTAQAGGMGGWFALSPDEAVVVLPGVTNKMDLVSLAFSASVLFDMEPVIAEQ